MTYEEILEKYGATRMSFDYYYKFTFTFVGVAEDGVEVIAKYGENSDDIYRHYVDTQEKPLNGICFDQVELRKGKETIAKWREN